MGVAALASVIVADGALQAQVNGPELRNVTRDPRDEPVSNTPNPAALRKRAGTRINRIGAGASNRRLGEVMERRGGGAVSTPQTPGLAPLPMSDWAELAPRPGQARDGLSILGTSRWAPLVPPGTPAVQR